MKKLFYLLSVVLFAFTACKDDDDPATLSISKDVLSVVATGVAPSELINVTSNVSWSVSSNKEWCKPTSTSGTGNGNFALVVLANEEQGQQREAIVTISATNVDAKTIKVTQDGAAIALELLQSEYKFFKDGGSLSVKCAANVDVDATIEAGCTWIELGDGPAPVRAAMSEKILKFYVHPNTDLENRTATIEIKAGTITKTVTIIQAMGDRPDVIFTFGSLDTLNCDLNEKTNAINLRVTSNQEVVIESPEWITVDEGAASGDMKSYALHITENLSDAVREGKVVFSVASGSVQAATLVVKQTGCSFATDSAAIEQFRETLLNGGASSLVSTVSYVKSGTPERITELTIIGGNATGPIDPCIGRLTKLQKYSLRLDNSSSTTLPKELFSFPELKEIVKLTSKNVRSLPAINMPNLEKISILEFPEVEVFAEIENAPKLSYIKIARNDIMDAHKLKTIPASFSKLEKLGTIIIDGANTGFNGPLPDISKMEGLTYLQIGPTSVAANSLGNYILTGTLPDLSKLKRLDKVYLRGLQDPDGLKKLAACTSITVLVLKGGGFTGDLPDFSKHEEMTNLTVIDCPNLSGTVATKNLPPATTLSTLELSNNALTGKLPRLNGYTKVTKHLFNDNNFQGYDSLSYGSSVWSIDYSNNPNLFKDMDSKTVLAYLTKQATTAGIIGTAKASFILNLSNTGLSGIIPVAFNVGAGGFRLDNNNLTDTIPSTLVWSATNRYYRLDNNKLTGKLPAELKAKLNQQGGVYNATSGALTLYFSVAGNQLTGEDLTSVITNNNTTFKECWCPQTGVGTGFTFIQKAGAEADKGTYTNCIKQ